MIVILGNTATGKTELAANLAIQIHGEIIRADSRQVYKYMDIGTGKDLNEYNIEGYNLPYYLIDIVEPGEEYNLFRFLNDFTLAYDCVVKNNKIPILCGGSGMYLDAVLRNYQVYFVPKNEELRQKLNLKSKEFNILSL